MHSSISLAMASAAMFLSSATAHMIMLTPTPFNNATINNSPLAGGGGGQFPCKYDGTAGFYDAGGITNTMAIGQPQTLSFRGSAVHGGGSCQLALTTDMAPTASSTWMVIHSIEGGCPSKTGDGPSTYQYTVPNGIAPGKYVFAWTWISKLAGQPEYYMNCAPVTVTGGSTRRSHPGLSRRASFPNLFVANVGLSDCKTTPGTDPVYPDPGDSVEKPGATPNYAAITATDCLPLGGSAGSGTSSGGGSAGASSAATSAGTPTASTFGGTTASATTASSSSLLATGPVSLTIPTAEAVLTTTPAVTPTLNTTVATTPASSLATAAPSATSIAGSPRSATVATSTAIANPDPPGSETAGSATGNPASTPSASGSSGATSAAGTQSGPCTSEGTWNCIDGNSFQRCASGQWSVVTPMAGGTSCTPGESSSFTIIKRGAARRFSRQHLQHHRARAWGRV